MDLNKQTTVDLDKEKKNKQDNSNNNNIHRKINMDGDRTAKVWRKKKNAHVAGQKAITVPCEHLFPLQNVL